MRVRSAVVVAGLAVAAVSALGAGLPTEDAVQLVAISFGVAALVGILGRLAVPAARRRWGTVAGAALVAAVPVVVLIAGVLVAARAMFVSDHDLSALLVIVAGAGTAGALGALAFAADLTRAQREAEVAQAREVRIDRSRRELVAWVSHDLRTPLAGVRAMAEAIADGVVDDEPTIARYHAQIVDEVDRLASLVDDLFELSRIEADALCLSLEPLCLEEIVADAVAGASVHAEAKGVRIDRLHDAVDATVVGSAPELVRVLRNLLDNAVRHTPHGGRVTIHLDADVDAPNVEVRVSDQCGGIPDDDLERVFDLAYRGDRARSTDGAGLGLAIARGFVEAHHGDIDVENLDDGCCFRVRLPTP